uniref:NYN domain-containing protein n=1 Tax=Brassica oleracea TaxID=3712 RepID=A0A3P6FXY0_BRAOL|nr:unnamed protein product [Brassica oleracea]
MSEPVKNIDPGYTGVFWDYDGLHIAGSFNLFDVHFNLKASLAKKNLSGFFELNFYCDKELPVLDYLVQSYSKVRLCFVPDVRSDKLKHNVVDPGDIATENFDWLWQSIMFGDKPFIDPSETRAGYLFCSGCHAEVSITEDEDEEGDGQQTEVAVVKL